MKKFNLLSLLLVAASIIVIASPLKSNAMTPTTIFAATGPQYQDGNGNPQPTPTTTPNTGTCDGSTYTSSTPVADNVLVCGYIKPATEFLSAGVGVVVILMIMIGGIQYITSDGSPQSIAKAKKKIINGILALIIFALMYAFLNFIIPGGIITI